MAEEPQFEKPAEQTEEHVHGENCDHDHEEEGPHDPTSNRGEKKFKKAMTKMGLKTVTAITNKPI